MSTHPATTLPPAMDAELDVAAAAVVAQAPPLPPAVKAHLRDLFTGTETAGPELGERRAGAA